MNHLADPWQQCHAPVMPEGIGNRAFCDRRSESEPTHGKADMAVKLCDSRERPA